LKLPINLFLKKVSFDFGDKDPFDNNFIIIEIESNNIEKNNNDIELNCNIRSLNENKNYNILDEKLYFNLKDLENNNSLRILKEIFILNISKNIIEETIKNYESYYGDIKKKKDKIISKISSYIN
jgi:hypothetical protein